MPASSVCEQELVVDARNGRAEALSELDRRLRPRLVRWLTGRMGNAADAEDVAQTALARGLTRLDQYEPRRPIWAWIRTIAGRAAIDHARREGRRSEVGFDRMDLPDESRAPDAGLLQAERRTRLWMLVDHALPAPQSTALRLHYIEGLDAGQIAKRMNLSRTNVRVMLCRGRQGLLDRLEREPEGNEYLIGGQGSVSSPRTGDAS